MEEANKRKISAAAVMALYSLLVSAVVIGLCSRSSPLYPLNDWADVNCFFTVGKAMFNGRVVYRDIYEQKGVLLYFLYGLGWLISHKSFLGAYLMETVCFAGFLFLAGRTARIITGNSWACLVLPCLAAVAASSYAFFLGGSAEEISLPFLYLPLHCFIKTSVERREILPSKKWIFALGFAGGCILWIKFSLLGIYVGYVLYIAAAQLARRDLPGLGRAAGLFLLGTLAASLPWLIYFGVNHALEDLFVAYFYNNVMLYSNPELQEMGRLAFLMRNLRFAIFWNGRTSLAIALGFAAAMCCRLPWQYKGGLVLLYACAAVFPYIGGSAYDYYAMALVPLSVPGFVFLAWLGQKLTKNFLASGSEALRRTAGVLLCLVLLVGGGFFARRHSVNSFYMDYDREDLWYNRFAEIIAESEDQSLLNYGSLDRGLYTVTGYVPQTKYFCMLNIHLPEMLEEQDRYVRERETAFVVTPGEAPAWFADYYELVESIPGIAEFENHPTTYTLYRRK